MKYKRIEYKILQTTSRGIWAWSFDPPKAVEINGKSKGGRSDAVAAVQRAIDKWRKSKADEATSRAFDVHTTPQPAPTR